MSIPREEPLPQTELDVDVEKRLSSSLPSDAEMEGTARQNELGPKLKRAHFFSPLDPAVAEAVNKDAETVEYTPEEDYKVKRKIDNVVLPLIKAIYVSKSLFIREPFLLLNQRVWGEVNQFDRTNIGNAHVITAFNENFGITDNQKWTLALSIFYVGYCLLEMPANVLQRRIGANRLFYDSFFLSLTFWGLASLSFVYAKGYGALLALRVLLGIGEAGYYAGMIYYLSFWYKRHELAMRVSLCMTGTYPGAIGGLLAFGLVRAKTSLLDGWQFLYLIEAIPTLIMASMILFFLPPFPFFATFLTPRERAIAQARLNRDHKPQSHGGMNGWQGFKAVVTDIHAWMFMTIYASFNVGVATISYFLPTIIAGLGFTAINAQGLTVAPYIAGWFMVVFQAWHSDKTRDRGWHIMLSCFISFVGYLILATAVQKSVGAAYFALFLVIGGLYSLFPLVMSWAANTFAPTSKRGVGTAFIVSISNCVSIASPQIYFDPQDSYRKGHAIAAGCVFLSMLVAFLLHMRLSKLNKRNAQRLDLMTEDEKVSLGQVTEMSDSDPRYVFMT
ncbi:MFS general substrate transporter [Lentinula edodes]|nr:MFS general substrate transporter [Lentinula edodes]